MISLPAKGLICVFFFIISLSEAKLAVKTPYSLREQFDKINGIDYAVLTPQNKITYKRSFIGNLVLADPEHGCDNIRPLNAFGDNRLSNLILLVDWGECHYPQKIKNAEIAGAKMLILILRNDMPMNHPAIKQIPLDTTLEVLAVSKTDGDILMSFLKDVQTKDIGNSDSVVELTYSYDVERHVNYQKGDKVVIDFWFAATDRAEQAYQFIEDFGGILREFGDRIEFNPHYVLWYCDECKLNDWQIQKHHERCVSGGRYCDPEPITVKTLSGSLGVIENLRQICFRDLSDKVTVGDTWWRYTINFGKKCINKRVKDLQKCRKNIYIDQDISVPTYQLVENNMRNSFVGAAPGSVLHFLQEDNLYLKKELELKEEMHVDHYPALYVNKERYIGNFRNLKGIEELICSNFVTPPSVCIKMPSSLKNEEVTTVTDSVVYVSIIFMSIIIMAIMLYCVRRSVKRQVMGKMNDEISHIVTQYKQFKDKSSTLGGDDDA